MKFLLDTDHISILHAAPANRDNGSADCIDCVKSGIDVIDTQLARLRQGSAPGHRRLVLLTNPERMKSFITP